MSVFRKRSNKYDWQQEQWIVRLVAGRMFAPQVLDAKNGYVVSTYGTDLLHFVRDAPSPAHVCLAVQGALCALRMLHDDGFYHLDAKASNFIVCSGARDPGKITTTDFVIESQSWHVAIIDYETLFVPSRYNPDKQSFNRDSEVLAEFGRQPHAFYETDENNNYRFDVFSLCSSLLHNCSESEHAAPLVMACAKILGHIPIGVPYQGEQGAVTYFDYLLDVSAPVATCEDAILNIQVAYLPSLFRSTVWLKSSCECVADVFCAACIDATTDKELLPSNCLAAADLNGTHDKILRENVGRAFRLCNMLAADFRKTLESIGARPGDVSRLLAYI